MRTLSLNTTPEKVLSFGSGVLAPLATKQDFLMNYIFTSNIMWHSMKVCPGGIAWSLLRNWKTKRLFFIYLLIESHQRVFPASLSSIYAYFIMLGTITPYLCVLFFKRTLTAPIICSRFLSVKGVHQEKAGLDMSLLASAYSVTWTGYEYFVSLRGTHVSVPSFHSTHMNQPFVVCLRDFLPFFAVFHSSPPWTACP